MTGPLQWVQRPRTPVMDLIVVGVPFIHHASMGPASENAGYTPSRRRAGSTMRLQWVQRTRTPVIRNLRRLPNTLLPASMGPASENAGYAAEAFAKAGYSVSFNGSSVRERRLFEGQREMSLHSMLQWVQRPRTPVICLGIVKGLGNLIEASMGPASENAGYMGKGGGRAAGGRALQWVQRPRTPVIYRGGSMVSPGRGKLQWVQRPRTPVIYEQGNEQGTDGAQKTELPMGPASENAGYICHHSCSYDALRRFNGSSVRERRLYSSGRRKAHPPSSLQWVQRPRTPVITASHRKVANPTSFNGSSVRERRLYNTNRKTSCPCRSSFNGTSVRERRLCIGDRRGIRLSIR